MSATSSRWATTPSPTCGRITQRITNIHVKDRKSNRGREMPFGEGETPLREVLTLVRTEKYDIPVCIEYVGPDGPAVELKRCLDYCRGLIEA